MTLRSSETAHHEVKRYITHRNLTYLIIST